MFPSLELISLIDWDKKLISFFKIVLQDRRQVTLDPLEDQTSHSPIHPSSLRFLRVVLEKYPSHFGLQITTAPQLGIYFPS